MRYVFILLIVSLHWIPSQAHSESPLLRMQPPCPPPADAPPPPPGVTYDARREQDVLPADIGGPPPPISMDIPLGIPLPQVSPQAQDLSLSQVPVGTVKLRDGAVEHVEILGQSASPLPAGMQPPGCPPPHTRP
jgi:hypothetical protein